MKTFAPLIIFFVAVSVITVVGILYEGRWRRKRIGKGAIEERRRDPSHDMRTGADADGDGA
jgi:hypothetical protein